MGNLRKKASQCGVSPIGSQDEMLTELVTYMEANGARKSSDDTAGPSVASASTTGKGTPVEDSIAVAQEVLRLNEYDDFEGIMNVGNGKERLTAATPHAQLRKAYLKLSLLIHPDKLQSKFPQATTAFQCLVRAFELITAPVMTDTDTNSGKSSKAEKKNASISRSNDGCFRTRVSCPRCKQPWSEGTLDGNPDYVYTFMMQGLKQYTCSTCLCEFGCMTALHICPFCRGTFEYSPQDYHRKLLCGNPKCKKEFGFMLYHASTTVINDLKRTLKEDQERRTKVVRVCGVILIFTVSPLHSLFCFIFKYWCTLLNGYYAVKTD